MRGEKESYKSHRERSTFHHFDMRYQELPASAALRVTHFAFKLILPGVSFHFPFIDSITPYTCKNLPATSCMPVY